MFPWLKGEPERLPANGFRNRPEPSGAKNIRSMEVGANRQSYSDQDLGRAFRVQEADRSINNPYNNNIRQISRNGRQRGDQVNGRGINTNMGIGDNLGFYDTGQHKALEQNKQQYQDFYKNNVSEFQKRMNGQAAAPSYEERKKRLQYESNEGESGIMTRLQYKNNNRVSVSPTEYANLLKKQIEEKKEQQRQQRREETDLLRNDSNIILQTENNIRQGERYSQYEEGTRKVVSLHIQQPQKNVGFNSEEYDSYSNDLKGRRSPGYQEGARIDTDIQRDRRIISQSGLDKIKERNFFGDMQDRDIKEQEQRKARQQEFYKGLDDERKDRINKVGNREVSWGKEKSMVEQLGDKLAQEEEKKAVLKADLAEELMQQIKDKKRLQREEKERQEMLDRKYDERVKAEAEQMKQKYEAELQGKQHEIKSVKKAYEKKKQEQKDKLNESLLSKNNSKSPDLTKIDASSIMPRDKTADDPDESNFPLPPLLDGQVDNVLRDLNSSGGNELDLRGFQRDHGQEQNNQQKLQSQPITSRNQINDMQFYQKSPQQQPYPQSSEINIQPTQNNYQYQQQSYQQQPPPSQPNQQYFQVQQQQYQQMQYQPNYSQQLQQSQAQQQPEYFQSQMLPIQRNALEGQQSREEIYPQQDEIFAGREVNQHWNPPKFWEYKDKKNEEELNQLRAQLDAQTSALSTEGIKIRQDLRAAAERKTQALVDLENLKDQLRRQNNESLKRKQLNNNNNNNMDILSNNSNSMDILHPNLNNQSKLAGAANLSLLNFSNFSAIKSNSNQASFMNGNGSLNSNRQHLNRQPEKLDKYVSNNFNILGSKSNNNQGSSLQPLDYKLEKRLNGVILDKADMQLLEVDNLLNHLRYPL